MSTVVWKRGSATMKIPGAELFYEVQGSGPVLLMISGGPTDAGAFVGLVEDLADRFTVVRYDPRGNSRSKLDGLPEDQDMDVHADDAKLLLAMFGEDPAYVLGSSGGAQIGLNLAVRHPARVAMLVAHEPPCRELLPDAAEEREKMEDLCRLYKSQGAGTAMQKFLADMGLDSSERSARTAPPSSERLEEFGRIQNNVDYFLAHGMRPISSFVPNVARLKAGKPRIVVGIGERSKGQFAYRTALVLAEQLGTKPVVFPGDHNGYRDEPEAFAAKLREVFGGEGGPA